MAGVDIDRQAIEKRDFPIARRGYSPAAVDAHLRAVAAEVDELQRVAAGRSSDSLAATAGTQVQSIIEAAEAAAAEIESQSQARANTARGDADRDAQTTRAEAIARARGHVAAVAKATATLLERVESMDKDLSELLQGLRGGATRLMGDLTAVETNMGELYDAASRTAPAPTGREHSPAASRTGLQAEPVDSAAGRSGPAREPAIASSVPAPAEPSLGENGDLDGARLTALNMALNGEPREEANRYLAENFELADREKLIDEVYAAIEG